SSRPASVAGDSAAPVDPAVAPVAPASAPPDARAADVAPHRTNTAPMTPAEKEDAPLAFRDLLAGYGALARRALRYWPRGLAAFAVVFLAGMAWVVTRPRTFRSEARFQVQAAEIAGGSGPGAEEVQRSLENRLSQVYGSRTNTVGLIRRLRLYPRLRDVTSETKLAELFWASLDRSVQADTVQVGYRYGDPEDARRVVQGLVDLFVRTRRDTAIDRAREALTTVDAELAQIEGSLAERQRSLDRFVLANQAMVDEVRLRTPGPLRVVIARNGAVSDRASPRTRRLQAVLAQLSARAASLRASVAPAATDDEPADLAAMRDRLRAKQTEVDALRARGLLLDHPTRAAAERELAGLRAELDAAVARRRGATRPGPAPSPAEREQRVAALDRDIQRTRTELAASQRADGGPAPGAPDPLTRTSLVAVEAEFNRLNTDVTTTRASYQELLTRKLHHQGALRRAELGGEQIRVLDEPSRPVEPEPPGRARLATIASLLAALVALGTALISGLIDTRIYDQEDLRRWGEVAELPFIPDLQRGSP
ncbi:MAG: Lipopolysaccharide biosynthesis chain length determinant protein, partial [Myxococcaceae bacterium]|nr:Lipopolysaccharide biosynthesis chain length determinant protein [Myxococcaceae bacterium]